ncbi:MULTISPECIES: lipid A export permease/ATP-binding protein MsbA [unclassified Psychrobacter]|jgi:subfamily B ATP-binding cassette protein MsbA|uniref:lipid A export permease/ATP-binding protein MsbA n=1 Tax=unclassified Psychrobacter TaxID=196806 RepID=UPI0004251567|nr:MULTISPECIES: lipid A export permease/ATP-binding protein MsbA [unclassified Psychrobacter]MCG3883053.1 lipid A export permease/ATP-binding protein MsbA [Psychrobacter sp. Ps3]
MSQSRLSHTHNNKAKAQPERVAPPKHKTLLRLLRYLKPYWWALLLTVLGFAINAATEIWIAKLLQYITDAINQNDQAKQNLFPLLIIGLFFVRGVGSFLGNYYSALVSRNLVYELRVEVFNKLLRLPSSFYLANPAGTISSKLIFDVEQVTAASTDSMKTVLRDGLTVVALIGFLLYSNWRLTLILFLVLPPILWLIRIASKRYLKLSKGIQQTMGDVSHITNEVIGGYQVVKNYGGQAYESKRFDKTSKKNLRQGMKVVVTNSINTPAVQLLMAMAMSVVVWLALRPQVINNISAGEFISYIAAAGLLSKPVRSLTDVNQKLQKGIAAGESIFALIDEPEEQDTGTLNPKLSGALQLDKVGLVYPDSTVALQDFSLDIKAGETVALVGRSGAGKSSLVNLLTRTLATSSGQITMDGMPIEEITLESLRSQIAMVNQQVVLFNTSVFENIAYGSLATKSQAEVERAAKDAFAHEFIMKMPQGYQSQIGAEGLQLSGGQRQRLSIARALLKDAPILILDEATSALDNESEYYIQQALDNVMKDRTTLVIAHRLTTIESADRIAVMDGGRIVEIGTHDSLLQQQGYYAQMYERDFE